MATEDDELADIESDYIMRGKMLRLLYAKRRRDPLRPGIGSKELEKLLECAREVLDFQLWYMREKSWIERTEDGYLAITAAGVEYIESEMRKRA